AMPIQVLAPEVASRIAAGEVVERPASAVKELVENSLDAGADEIRVEVREGGRRLVRVVDNGHGIPAAEAALAFERHATSKLRSADDLEHIATLGFRGEALASIASVAQVTLLTRHIGEEVGSQLRVEGGHLVSQEGKGAPPGTVVTVENLFYNVPARLKFLRQPATESGHITDVVQRFAMAFPERRFSLVSDGRLAFQSTGSGRLHDVLVKVWGLDAGRQLAAVESGAGDASTAPHVAGFASLPTLSRSNRNHILFFLNRRAIQDRSLAFAVTEAYRNRLMVGRYPVAVLMIELDPALVDVNVHPAKAEVRFREERAVFRAVQKAVHATLAEHAPAPEVRSEGLSWSMPGWAERREALLAAGQSMQPPLALPREPAPVNSRPWPVATDGSSQETPWRSEPDVASPHPDPVDSAPATDVRAADADSSDRPSAQAFPILRVVGQMGATYIVAEGPEGMYLVDQHAAHERILFEQMLGQQAAGDAARQALLEPLAFEAGSGYAGLLAEYSEALAAAGFGLEPFGGDTWLVRSVPAVYSRVDPRRALEETLEGIADGRDLVGESKEAALVAVICKRAAIKGGQVLTLEEMRQLVRQLEACRDPGSCPHGRPTMLMLSRTQLEKEFGRRG
ncbi:MAG TPA: DNA mismatch repair endonuclease MutL, partial [Anaerolineae bacterium]|nr:DNA mismatch repair endonuclease MutL [Anaerolineae bacterium]